jgi:Ran GTPase-activating protein (RanGAP) involved in mRNA processing and transport
LSFSQIQKWITAIPHHIKEIIRCEGGNEYKEGRDGFKRSFTGRILKGKLSTHQFVEQKKHQASNKDTGDSEDEEEDEEEDNTEEETERSLLHRN